MDEVGGALIAIALVLSAVFIPAAFITGISGQFFRQFAVTIATSTVISLPRLADPEPGALRAPVQAARVASASGQSILHAADQRLLPRLQPRPSNGCPSRYGRLTGRLVRVSLVMVVVYAGLIGLTGLQFARAPTGFIPQQDQGYLINIVQLPPGASLARTDEVVRRATKIVLDTPGVAHAVPFAGLDGATFTNAPNAGVIFTSARRRSRSAPRRA